MNLTVEQNKKLTEIYPYLLPRNVWTGEVVEDYDFSYTEVWQLPDGWHRLFLLYCKNLRPYLLKAGLLNKYRFSQLKEKYGTLRIYDFGCPESAAELSTLYECYSKYVCQRCGDFSKWETAGWIGYYCNECIKSDYCVTRYPVKRKSVMKLEAYKDGVEYNLCYTYKYLEREYKKVMKMTDEEFFNYITNI